MDTPAESPASRVLRHLARWIYDRPRIFIYPQILLFGFCVVYTVQNLKFNTSRTDLVGAEKEHHRNLLTFKREFVAQDDIVAVVESEDHEKNRQFVERLGARLQAETNLFTDIIFNNSVKMLGNKALLFFPEDKLEDLGTTLKDYQPFIRDFAKSSNLVSLFRRVNTQFRTTKPETNAQTSSLVNALPALERIIRLGTDSLNRPGAPPSPGLTALFNAGAEAERRTYITLAEGRIYLLSARPAGPKLGRRAVQRMRELAELTSAEVPGVNAALTGAVVLDHDEMAQSQSDTTFATIASLILVALIFIYGYNETGRPIKAVVCLVIGLGYTMAFTTAVIGHLNILTITFVPMLIGLAIDFGVHLITRYEEELRHGQTKKVAIEKAIVNTGLGIFTGCFTTAGAFLAMGITDFKGVREMGIICGGGLLICLVPMMTLLPVLILRGRQNVLDHDLAAEDQTRARIEQVWLSRPRLVVALTLLLSAWSVWQGLKVHFDYNLLNLQSRDLPSVGSVRKLIQSADKSLLYCAVITDSLTNATALEATLTNLPVVASVDSIALYLSEDQVRKLGLVSQVKQALEPVRFSGPDLRPANILELSRTLYYLQGYLGLALQEVSRKASPDPELLRSLQGLHDSISPFRKTMLAGDREHNAEKLASYQQALFADLRDNLMALRDQDNRDRMHIEDLPPLLRHRFISRSSNLYLLQVFPRKDVWERANQQEFVGALRAALDPGKTGKPIITGEPVQLLEYTQLLRSSYQEAAAYALGAITLLVFIHFRTLSSVLLCLAPVALGTLWMLGFMGWRDIPFNPANIMTLPLVIGVGVTSGIHILNRFAEERRPSILAKSTGKAVLVSALTTMVGFGALIFGKHQGIQSLGYIMTVGTGTCMVAAVTFLPAVLTLMMRFGWRIGGPPSPQTPVAPTGSNPP